MSTRNARWPSSGKSRPSTRPWATYPGVFAAKRIDEGTALLIGVLPPLRADARVLDYGCGSGVIGASAAARAPAIALDLLDNDSVALEAARENVPGARGEAVCFRIGARFSHQPRVAFDAEHLRSPAGDGQREVTQTAEEVRDTLPGPRIEQGGNARPRGGDLLTSR